MNRFLVLCLVWVSVCAFGKSASSARGPSSVSQISQVRHAIQLKLQPEAKTLEVTDTMDLQNLERFGALSRSGGQLGFLLHDGLQPEVLGGKGALVVGSLEGGDTEKLPIRKYVLKLEPGQTQVTLHYAGVIDHPLSTPEEEYARGFSDTPGIISSEGVYLAGSSYWVPRFGEELVTFTLDTEIGSGWDTVSQGARTQHEQNSTKTLARWETAQTQDEIYVIAAPFTEYDRTVANGIQAIAFLRTPDPELANQYLTATGQYLQMYSDLLGAYPYGKFALVENFWETGYGMPSFTLLGPKIIRFPFIINSSYPHEILHNWWGNGVLVQYSAGNWCEGSTAYLADHLLKEQQGGGQEYRRTTLQKYVDFVSEGNDFPLTQFTGRHNSSSEAIGYGKALMLFHMLRVKLGDDVFKNGMRRFYRDMLYQRATYSDIERALETESGKDLSKDFTQWVTRVGAPEIKIVSALADKSILGQDKLILTLEQQQATDVFEVEVPVAISIKDQAQATQLRVSMNSKRQEFAIPVTGQPYFVEVDPEFDVFRKPDRFEIPPALSQTLGAKKALIVISSSASAPAKAAYQKMAAIWRDSTGPDAVDIKMDTEVKALPSDRSVWILGPVAKFEAQMNASLSELGFSVTADTIKVGKAEYPRSSHSFAVTVRHPSDSSLVVTWVSAGVDEAIAGLSRKLPHYGKYSYLVFSGAEPKAVSQGVWALLHSPMSVSVVQKDGKSLDLPKAKLKPRQALVELPSLFSAASMKSTIEFLASERLKGRELGTSELDEAADYIRSQFQKFGLSVAEQKFEATKIPPPKTNVLVKNIIASLPGRDSTLAPLVLGAHYDHLGMGYPDTHAADRGKIHPGADDNASGIAVMLEMARYFSEQAKAGAMAERAIQFVAFSGEESGLLGSAYFVTDAKKRSQSIFAMVNLDTVGRLGANKLSVFGTGTANEFQGMLMGIGYVTGVPIQTIPNDIGSGDQGSFIAAGIPAIHLFSGANTDYHRSSDTADKIDYTGIVKVAAVTKEAVQYLANRKEALTGTPSGGQPGNPTQPGTRKVYLGTMPDFAFTGTGVRIASVAVDSPAAKAGLAEGDVVVRMNSTDISDLKGYSAFLKTLKGGDQVQVTYLRGSETRQTLATVIER